MKIQEATLALAASHQSSSSQTLAVARTAGFREVYSGAVAAESAPAARLEQRVEQLLRQLVDAILAALDGRAEQAKLADPPAIPAAAAAPRAVGRELVWQETTVATLAESERTTVCGKGQVKTCDGRDIAFDFSLAMARDYRSVTATQTSGSSIRLKDPLMLSFGGGACALSSERIDFDLDGDGRPEAIPTAAAGCGFLVFDRNGNGRADDGSELFGVKNGDGFAELRRYDGDGNGWIDEADPVFDSLALWSGTGLTGLREAGVGALCLEAVDAPFALKTASNQLLGEIRAAGFYLNENGTVGALQQVDLALSAPVQTAPEPAKGQQLAT